jgi:Tol biopolymer transport system component
MGEVYRARDTRLDRTVAVKVLPPAFASDEQLRLRFEREARVISKLSHPNICTLHDVGVAAIEGGDEDPGPDSAKAATERVHFLVMEYLEGENLAERLARGRLPLDQALRLGIELASALDCAHRQGVTHRDLKPANVILTRGGAKLVDFGLARTGLTPAERQKDPTIRVAPEDPLTTEGTILGTWPYMAPEQLSGETVDARADLFALGAVLYEMLTGRKAFDGTSVSGLMAAVLTADPRPIRELEPGVPPALEQLVGAMLAKDREQRVQTAHDVRLQLRWVLESLSRPGLPSSATAASLPRRRAPVLAVAVAVAVAVVAAGAALLRARGAPAPPLVRFSLPPPPDLGYVDLVAVSPDGRSVAYGLAPMGGRSSLWLRNLDRDEPRRLEGTDGAYSPFFSPDGRSLGFFSGEQMKKLDLDHGTVESICEARGHGGASWGRSGVVLFAPRYEGELWRVDATGGTPVPETRVENESLHVWPHFLPDGERYLCVAWRPGGGGVLARRLGSDEEKTVLAIGSLDELTIAAYAAGKLFFVRSQSLFAQAFDPKALRLSGAPRRVAEGLRYHGPGMTPFAVSGAGTAAYIPDGGNTEAELFVVDRRGTELQRVGSPVSLSELRVSPDGELVAASIDEPLRKQSIWLIDVRRGARTPTTEGWADSPVWLRDGSGLVFSRAADGPPNLHRVSMGREVERLSTSAGQQVPTSIAPDGSIVFETLDAERQFDILLLQADGTTRPLLAGPSSETDGQVSPDGLWLAFRTNESGRNEVYVTAFPRPERRWRISEAGGRSPRWSRDGRELFFLSRDRLMRVPVSTTDGFEAGAPEPLFDLEVAEFDPMPGGRFLVARRRISPSRPPLRVVSGWQNLTRD